MDWTVLLPAGASIAAIITAIAGYVKGWSERHKLEAERHKLEADHDEVITRAALSLLAPLEARVDQQAARITELESQERVGARRITELESQVEVLLRENEEMHDGVRILCGQISALGQEPRWHPGSG